MRRLLALGPAEGWHADQLRAAARRHGCELVYADYESLAGTIESRPANAPAAEFSSPVHRVVCSAGDVRDFVAVLCRTMPMASMERILFRLATLHALHAEGSSIVNPPRTLEIAIDKYATLAIVGQLGYDVPPTRVVQDRNSAMQAFDLLGGDVVVKPIFGGEGRGVMRVRDRQLAWTVFSTLDQLQAVHYIQPFVAPGGRDLRLLVVGDEVLALRRTAPPGDFRTNVASGGSTELVVADPALVALAMRIANQLQLRIGSIDLLETVAGPPLIVEVNGIPGWKGAQECVAFNIAERMIAAVLDSVAA